MFPKVPPETVQFLRKLIKNFPANYYKSNIKNAFGNSSESLLGTHSGDLQGSLPRIPPRSCSSSCENSYSSSIGNNQKYNFSRNFFGNSFVSFSKIVSSSHLTYSCRSLSKNSCTLLPGNYKEFYRRFSSTPCKNS